MSNRCIICVANGHWYPRGAERQRQSLIANGFDGDVLQWVGQYPPGSPPHSQIPYAFKPYAFAEARRQGYQSVLWMDASCYATSNVSAVFEQIEHDGYLLFANGAPVGEWCADTAMPGLGLSREQAMGIPEISACVMGLDFSTAIAQAFFGQWMSLANDGITFTGSHRNDAGQCSADPRVKGHRHDQTAASVVSSRLGMVHTHMPKHLAYLAYGTGPETVIVNSGM